MTDITEIFELIIRQSPSIDIAEAEFKRQIGDDPEMRSLYREWCRENGSSERNGFFDYCEEIRSSQNDIWDTLNDYDEQE